MVELPADTLIGYAKKKAGAFIPGFFLSACYGFFEPQSPEDFERSISMERLDQSAQGCLNFCVLQKRLDERAVWG